MSTLILIPMTIEQDCLFSLSLPLPIFFVVVNQGRVNKQSPTATNHTVDFSELGEILRIDKHRVQCMSLTRGKAPLGFWYLMC